MSQDKTLIRLPAPCCADSFITCDADGYFKRSEGQGANRDAMRMTRCGRLSMPALAAYMTELRHAEALALGAHSTAERTHGVLSDHPDIIRAEANVGRASDRVLRLLAWVSAARPVDPVDIGTQIYLILSITGEGGCIRPDELKAFQAASHVLINSNSKTPKAA